MPPDNSIPEDRYHHLLEEIGEQRKDLQRMATDLAQQQLEQWKATSTAIRTLSDWWAHETDADRAERRQRRAELDAALAAIRHEQAVSVLDRAHLRRLIWALIGLAVVVPILIVLIRVF